MPGGARGCTGSRGGSAAGVDQPKGDRARPNRPRCGDHQHGDVAGRADDLHRRLGRHGARVGRPHGTGDVGLRARGLPRRVVVHRRDCARARRANARDRQHLGGRGALRRRPTTAARARRSGQHPRAAAQRHHGRRRRHHLLRQVTEVVARRRRLGAIPGRKGSDHSPPARAHRRVQRRCQPGRQAAGHPDARVARARRRGARPCWSCRRAPST